jgi:hypothetical protein
LLLLLDGKIAAAAEAFLPACFREFGLSLKVESKAELAKGGELSLEGVEFCRSRCVNIGGRWTMVRDFHRAISTVLCGTRWQRDLTNFKSLAKAVGLGDGQFAYGVPVLQEFYALMRTLGGSTEIDRQGWTYRTYRWWGQVIPTDVQVEEISPATRNSFTLAFGFTPQQQIALEFEMRTLAAVL